MPRKMFSSLIIVLALLFSLAIMASAIAKQLFPMRTGISLWRRPG